MDEFATKALQKYGWKSVFYPVVLGITIWALTHCAAAPGTQVNVLWGLTSYTKGSSIKSERAERSNEIIRRGENNKRDYILSRPRTIIAATADMSSRDAYEFQQKTYKSKWMHIEGSIHNISGISDIASIQFIVEGEFAYAGTERVEFTDAEILKSEK